MNPQDPISARPAARPRRASESRSSRRRGPDLEDPQFYFNRELSLAGLQRARARARRGRVGAAHGAAEVRGDLHLEPRRVLHDPRRRPARPGRRRPGERRRRRPDAAETIDAIRKRAGELSDARRALRRLGAAPRAGRAGDPVVGWDALDAAQRRALRERFRRQIFPVLTPLAVGLGPPVPVHLEPVAEPRRAACATR